MRSGSTKGHSWSKEKRKEQVTHSIVSRVIGKSDNKRNCACEKKGLEKQCERIEALSPCCCFEILPLNCISYGEETTELTMFN